MEIFMDFFVRIYLSITLLFLLIVLGGLAKEVLACDSGCQPIPPKPKTVYITKTVEAKATPSNTNNQATATATNSATTGNQVVNVIQPQQKPVVVKLKRTIIKHRTKTVQKKVLVYKPNRLLLLGGATKTRLDIDFDCCNLDIKRRYEPDFGLQYLRDFGTISAGISATANRSLYLNVGVNW
jgi:hypothetical protein